MNSEKVKLEECSQNNGYQSEFQPTLVVEKKKAHNKRRSIDKIADELLKKLLAEQSSTPDFSDSGMDSKTSSKVSSPNAKDSGQPNDKRGIVDEMSYAEFNGHPAPDAVNYNLKFTDEQIRASMALPLDPVFGMAATASEKNNGETKPKGKNTIYTPTTREHRCSPKKELEKTKPVCGKWRGATYTCTLCNKNVTLNTSGSRYNLSRHVIQDHSKVQPFKCGVCNFIGLKNNVIYHAKKYRHQPKNVQDIRTDEMRKEWDALINLCFPGYFIDKEQELQSKPAVAQKQE